LSSAWNAGGQRTFASEWSRSLGACSPRALTPGPSASDAVEVKAVAAARVLAGQTACGCLACLVKGEGEIRPQGTVPVLTEPAFRTTSSGKADWGPR